MLVASGCSGVDDDVVVAGTAASTTTTSSTTTTTTTTTTTVPPTTAAPTTVATTSTSAPRTSTATTTSTGGGNKAQAYQTQLAAAITDIQAYWRTTFPQIYKKPYKDLKGGIWRAYPGVTNVPGCGKTTSRYKSVQGNAFYCRTGADFITYDDAGLFPQLYRYYGVLALGLVLAHEWGHAIQYRANVDGETILLEQQADCFAGSWMAHVSRGEAAGLTLGPKDLTSSLSGMLSYADPVGITSDQQGAHGSGFDRVGAFEDGYLNGAAKCATYPTAPPTVIELPFTAGDAATGGNLPYDQVVSSMGTDLDRFWGEVFQQRGKTYQPLLDGVKKYADASPYPTCGTDTSGAQFKARAAVYCAAGDFVAYDDDLLQQVNDVGDFAAGVFIGGAWADAAQTRLGSTLAGAERSLQQDCYTGAWAKSILPTPQTPDTQKFLLSAGDLDEGVIAFVDKSNLRDPIGGPAVPPFDRVAAFRKGILQGVAACG